jgi:hypothetical protein
VRWTYNGLPAVDEDRADVEYQFNDAAVCARFQEDVRAMDLRGTFDAETLRTHSDSKWGAASLQDVKLWRSRGPDGAASLSFFASRRQHHCEFPLEWFQRVLRLDGKRAAVELTFVGSPGGAAEADDAQEAASLKKKVLRSLSFGSASRSSVNLAAASPSSSSVAATSSSSSVGGPSSAASGSSSGPSLTHAQKMARRAREFQYLRIEFAPRGSGKLYPYLETELG